jgi:peptidoglycan/LPS O-acetylase OafA/YrhL
MHARRHIPALDGLRGWAIGLVLVHHLFVFEPADVGPVAALVELASHGVDLFFALSGFLISRQLAECAGEPGFARRFWLHRLAKIAPLYFTALAFVFLGLKSLLPLSGHPEKLGWLLASESNWPWYVLFLSNAANAMAGRFTNPALDVAWSLAVEVQFYLLAFLLARRGPAIRWPQLALGAIAVAILFRTILTLAGATWIQILVLTPGRLDAFAFGALAALTPRWLASIPAAFTPLLLGLAAVLPWSRSNPVVEIVGYSLVAIAAGQLIEAAARPTPPWHLQRILTQPFAVFLGRISYSIYLTHLPLRAALRDTFAVGRGRLDSASAWNAQLTFIVAGGSVCIGVGWLAWKIIEEPARRWILHRFSPARATSAAGTALP